MVAKAKEEEMILGETPQQKQDRLNLEDDLRRTNRGRRHYIDQFMSPPDWVLIKRLLKKSKQE